MSATPTPRPPQRHCDSRRAFHVRKLGADGCECGLVAVWADDSPVVNLHDELVAALRLCRAVIGCGSRGARLRVEPEAIAKAEAVLARADAGQEAQ